MGLESFSLEGQVALVTGGGRGLGLEAAKALASCGAQVLVNGRDSDRLQAACETISALGATARPFAFDIADEAAVSRAFAELSERFQRLDILVNNVGLRDRRDLHDFSLDDVRTLIEVNLVAPFNLSRQAARLMESRSYGRIINITSIAGPIAGPGDSVYTTAKGGLEALTRSLAAELGQHGITVNAVAPGFFATEANAEMASNPAIAEWLQQRTALRRWGEPREIAGAVAFLASPAASYVTGHLLVVDGGYLSHF